MCLVLCLLSQKDEILQILLYNYHGVRVCMQKSYHGAAETLWIHSFTSSVETSLGIHIHSLFAQVLRETWGWHQENQTSLLIMVNGSCICWSLWASPCLWIAPINIYGGMHIEGKKRIDPHWEKSRLQQFHSYHICALVFTNPSKVYSFKTSEVFQFFFYLHGNCIFLIRKVTNS